MIKYVDVGSDICCGICCYGTLWIDLCDKDYHVIWSSNAIDYTDFSYMDSDIDSIREELKNKLKEMNCYELYNPEIDSQKSPYDWELIGEED